MSTLSFAMLASPRLLTWLAAPLLATLTACAVAPPAPPTPTTPTVSAPLVGTEWRLEDISGRGVLDRVPATLGFPEVGRVAGNGSCNRFFGSVAVDQNLHIRFSQIGSTRMACPGAVGEQEGRYLAALQKVHHYELQGGQLLLYVEGENQPLRFTRTRP
jgi:heat shock protein HslJ